MAVLLYVVIGVVTVLVMLLIKALRTNQHWKKHGVPGPEPLPFVGNMLPVILGKKSTGEIYRDIYEAFPNEPAVGFYNFTQPLLLIRDVEIIQRIWLKDAAHFQRSVSSDVVNDPLNTNLFNLNGNIWRAVRAKFSPMFTTGKLKQMVPLIESVGEKYVEHFTEIAKPKSAMDLIKNYSIDAISTTAFGIEPAPVEDEDNEFRAKGREVLPPNLTNYLKTMMIFISPFVSKILGIQLSPADNTKYFTEAVKSVIRHRRENKTFRNDFVQSMITLQEKGSIEVEYDPSDEYLKIDDKGVKIEPTDDLLAGQAYGFLLAGFEATAIALTMMLYDLAANPGIQEKARVEVKRITEAQGKLDYDAMKEMKYLEGFMKESLRINSVATFLLRKSIRNYEIPEIGYTLSPGENVAISTEGVHMDASFYPEPGKIKPERWDDDAKIPMNRYLAFGIGPRICIGMRMALAESKTLLAKLLLGCRISLDPSMELPLKLNPPWSFFHEPRSEILLKLEKLNQ